MSRGKVSYPGENAFGSKTLAKAYIYIWPLQKRMQTDEGHYGSLHSKLAVADQETLFITSANLTEYAMELNMEMGVLIQGGKLPGQVVEHFEALIALGTLTRAKYEK